MAGNINIPQKSFAKSTVNDPFSLFLGLYQVSNIPMCQSRGGTGGPDLPEKSQKYRVS